MFFPVHYYREEVKLLVASNCIIAIANCYSRVKLISHVTGRCALFNVKLHIYYQMGSNDLEICMTLASILI